jgi:hypothetical protein
MEMKAELVYCTKFDWVNEKSARKALPYAALSAQEGSEESFEEFERVTSGYVNQRSYEWHKAQKRQMAITLFNLAVKKGFIDC